MKKFLDYQLNPVLFVIVFIYVMTDKFARSIFVKDYKPKRLYF
jgi:hypothetical protein